MKGLASERETVVWNGVEEREPIRPGPKEKKIVHRERSPEERNSGELRSFSCSNVADTVEVSEDGEDPLRGPFLVLVFLPPHRRCPHPRLLS